MKYFLIISSLLLFPFLKLRFTAQNYYVADAGTDAGSCPITAPCKTIAYINAFSLVPGDSIFFNRGDVFYGELLPNAGGSSSLPIWYGAYGTGASPIISGFYKLVGYTNVSGNIWSASCPSCQTVTNLVTYGGNLQGMGRTPNTGYNTVAVASGTSYITDPTLTGTPNYGGAQLVLRNNHYTMTRNAITSQDVDTLFYTAINGGATAGWGYFLQNSASTLDQNGEWFYNSGTNQMEIYLTDTTVAVNVGVIDTLVYAHSKNYITFDHLNFQGANDAAIELSTNTTVNVQNCTITLCNEGIIASNVSGRFVSDTVTHLNDYAMAFTSSTGDIIDNNTVYHIGEIPGMGIPTSAYEGMSLQISSSEINGNNLKDIGYDAMAIKGTLDTANYNLVDSFCYILDDGGGMYWYESLGGGYTGRRCIGNMVYNGIGAVAGTSGGIPGETGAVGIYTDQSSTNLEIDSCTLFNNSQAGLYIHSSQYIGVQYNTIFNNTWTQVQMTHDNATYPLLRGLNIKHNNIGSQTTPATQYLGVLYVLSSIAADYDSVGAIDSTNYITPTPTWWTGTSTGSSYLQTYSSWQAQTGTDGHSLFFPEPVVNFYYNPSQTTSLSLSPPTWSDFWLDYFNVQHTSYSLPALQSVILFPYRTIIPFGTIHKH